eukprot:CAMPEP_0179157268 /NCGR_PEP_ID=MMETSP0796-20121207/76704_1 /TAXON_ID=73915 /ORGANISM="Pyrodinium bahamense, Strain pbaha01" /LENGTH=498 /DNA_ID=CAMNT_0020858897 /DNA_START=1 /DNA_END=1498 /DNA_ORIENTATION=+
MEAACSSYRLLRKALHNVWSSVEEPDALRVQMLEFDAGPGYVKLDEEAVHFVKSIDYKPPRDVRDVRRLINSMDEDRRNALVDDFPDALRRGAFKEFISFVAGADPRMLQAAAEVPLLRTKMEQQLGRAPLYRAVLVFTLVVAIVCTLWKVNRDLYALKTDIEEEIAHKATTWDLDRSVEALEAQMRVAIAHEATTEDLDRSLEALQAQMSSKIAELKHNLMHEVRANSDDLDGSLVNLMVQMRSKIVALKRNLTQKASSEDLAQLKRTLTRSASIEDLDQSVAGLKSQLRREIAGKANTEDVGALFSELKHNLAHKVSISDLKKSLAEIKAQIQRDYSCRMCLERCVDQEPCAAACSGGAWSSHLPFGDGGEAAARAYCESLRWTVSKTSPGGLVCVSEGTSWIDNCNDCGSWRLVVWGHPTVSEEGPRCTSLVPGNYYCGHHPCGVAVTLIPWVAPGQKKQVCGSSAATSERPRASAWRGTEHAWEPWPACGPDLM